MDIRAALKEGMARLREGRVPSHTLAAELLLMHVLDCQRAWLYTHPELEMDAAATERYFTLVRRRITGTPTQYLTHWQEFWGLRFEVTPDVLIPRPETEHVVEVVLGRLGQDISHGTNPWQAMAPQGGRPASGSALRIADVGTGSGCLAVALATELPRAFFVATDISSAALSVARGNARRHQVALRISFVQANLLDAFCPLPGRDAERFDVIMSNPPYVGRSEAGQLPREVREHEPARALFSGESGLEIYGPLVGQAEKSLAHGGILVLELGWRTLEFVEPLLDSRAWRNVGVTNDLAGIPRVIAAERV